MEQDKHNYGLDVQRALAMLFVVLYHAPLYIPVLHDGADVGANRFLFILLKSVTSVCVDCFWLLTGYLVSRSSSFRSKALLSLWGWTLAYSWMALALAFAVGRPPEGAELFRYVFPILGGRYWLISVYVVLMILAPFLNVALSAFDRRRCLVLLAIFFVTFSVLPSLHVEFLEINHHSVPWAVVMYLAGAFLRLHAPAEPGRSGRRLLAYLTCVAAGVVCLVANVIWRKHFGTRLFEYDYCTFPMTALSALCLFRLCEGLTLSAKDGVARLAAACAPYAIGVYLFHDTPIVRHYLWPMVSGSDLKTPLLFPRVLLGCLVVFAMGILLNWALRSMTRFVRQRVNGRWLKILILVLLAFGAIQPAFCGLGVRSRLEKILYRGEISDWKGVALTPWLVQFSCEQTGESDPKRVLEKVREFRSKSQAYWPRPIGISRHDRDGRYGVFEAADVEHQVWFCLEKPMTEGESRTFTLPDGRTSQFAYSSRIPSPAIKINQLGYVPSAEEKYAYVGVWAGTAGEIELDVKGFRLVDEATGRAVFSGTAKRRPRDLRTQEGAPWTGDTPWELDISKFKTPGRYRIEVDGVGRSAAFTIGDESVVRSFHVHLAGMRRQRCGETCHTYAIRGNFPADDHYNRADKGAQFGFFDSDGMPVRLQHFNVIGANAERCRYNEKVRVEGGWHDAADYDRRPYHLQAVGDFAAVALVLPRCSEALEEAYWGLRHLLAVQEPNGGVGTWIETAGHPGVGEGPTSERTDRAYYIARPTRNSTLEYAAYAAMVALAMRAAGETASERFVLLTNSAVRAWNFALSPRNGGSWVIDYGSKRFVYRQDNELAAGMLAKAGYDLSLLTDDDDAYLAPLEQNRERVLRALAHGNNWKASPLVFIEFDHFERLLPGFLRDGYKAYVRKVTSEADQIVDQLESAWPYRIPWYSPASGRADKMGWGFGLPLTRARVLIAAHSMTWDRKYLTAAFLANDCHNGANPEGESYTRGLGVRSTGRYLDLEGKYPIGITPYRFSSRVEPKCEEWVFPDGLAKSWPIWRRYSNVEIATVPTAEFSVWETIAPAAAVTGYLSSCLEAPDWGTRHD